MVPFPCPDWLIFKTSNFSSMAVPRERLSTFQRCDSLRAPEKADKQIISSFSVMCVTDSKFFGWYMEFISYSTGVVHTLSYLLFSGVPDLLYCRCMGKNRHAVQLFTASHVREASRQFVRKFELYVASFHPTSVEKVPGKEFEPCA